ALQKIEHQKFDLFIVDMVMPRMNGLKLIQNILDIIPAAIIIMLTGHSTVEIAVKAVQAGVYKYLTKPINADELINEVKKGLEYAESSDIDKTGEVKPSSTFALNEKELMLNGFPENIKKEFLSLGRTEKYYSGDMIPLNFKNSTSIIIVEEGKISVWLKNIIIEKLRPNDVWGEENFVFPRSTFTTLRAETDVKILRLNRKKLINFFVYQNEKISKRYMINITSSIYFKWRKALQKNILNKLSTETEG
ncbi:MAG: response regulator, partial [Candidatus Cloacimonetes bacterium]|nr:response regulator [Candidatus Cloacimonadota bacterium]